jgi:hypothetical protein
MSQTLFWFIPATLLFVLGFIEPSMTGFYCALLIQIAGFFASWRMARVRGRVTVTCVGAFSFAYLLFYVGRPLFMVWENDLALFDFPLFVNVDFGSIYRATVWAAGGLIAFLAGATMVNSHDDAIREYQGGNVALKRLFARDGVDSHIVFRLLVLQFISTVILSRVGGAGKNMLTSTYSSAYVYFLPSMVQPIHLISVIAILDRQRRRSFTGQFTPALIISILLLLLYTYYLRNVSFFRGYYLTGLMAMFYGAFMCLRGRVGYFWVVAPMLIFMPLVTELGSLRTLDNMEIHTYLSEHGSSMFGISPLWTTFSSGGDMNIFDTFIAAYLYVPRTSPYILQWLYILVHWIPRAFWAGKPEGGMLVDVSFTYGAPFSPGLLGFYYLEGGLWWMLLCMVVTGAIMAKLDNHFLKLEKDFYAYCYYGTLVVNSLFAARVGLCQSVYQTLYMIVPCWLLNRWIFRSRVKLYYRQLEEEAGAAARAANR